MWPNKAINFSWISDSLFVVYVWMNTNLLSKKASGLWCMQQSQMHRKCFHNIPAKALSPPSFFSHTQSSASQLHPASWQGPLGWGTTEWNNKALEKDAFVWPDWGWNSAIASGDRQTVRGREIGSSNPPTPCYSGLTWKPQSLHR